MRTDPSFRAALPTLLLVLAITGVAAVTYPEAAPRAASAVPASTGPGTDLGSTSPVEDAPSEVLPARLGELRLFDDLPSLKPAAGTEPYDVRYPLWSDGTVKSRHHRLPAGAAIETTEDGRLVFPVGTIFTKTFDAPADLSARGRRLETRILKKTAERWLVGAYVWNDAGDDATLTDGYDRPLDATLPGCDGPYVVPGRVACFQCHAGEADMVLGFSPVQLGRDRLNALATAGRLLRPEPALAHAEIDASNDVEREALGYLVGNCAHCHNPASTAFVPSELDLRPAFARTAIGREAYRLQSEAARRMIVPGDASSSTLYRLFDRTLSGPNDAVKRMPPVGNQRVDPHGREVLERWIAQLPVPDGAPESAKNSE